MWLNQWKRGLESLGNEYESRFTEIAGRTGSATREDAHNIIANMSSTVVGTEYLDKGLNFNDDVFPAITDAVKKGFQGEKLEDVAITNAIDKKIMPWLETDSETWVNFQYNLSDDLLRQIKGQQLQLQATQEGNRILQNGVVSALLDELSPTLLNIDANTTDVSKLSTDAQATVAYLMKSGYSQQDAIKIANQAIKAYQNPYDSLTSNNPIEILMGNTSFMGGDLEDILGTYGNIGAMGIGTGPLGMGAIQQVMGVNYGNFTRTDDNAIDLSQLGQGPDWKQIQKDFSIDPDAAKQKYIDEQTNLTEHVTATQEHDNNQENWMTNTAMDLNTIAHGVDGAKLLLQELVDLKNWLMGIGITILVDKATDGAISKFGSKILGKLGGKLGGSAASSTGSILGSMGGGGASGALPTASTSAFASSSPILSKLGGGLATGAGGTTAAGLATLGGAAAGIGMAAYGGYQAYNEFSQIGKGSETDEENKNHAVSGGLAAGGAAAGAVGAGALLALGASNPVGWVALAIGGVALAGKAIYDHATRLSGLAEEYEARGEELKSAFQKEQETRIEESAFLKQRIKDAENDTEAQNEIINSGLLSEKTARDLSAQELSVLTTEIIKTESAITALGNAAIDAKTKVAKEEAQQQTKDVLDTTYDNIKNLLGDDKVVKEGETEYAQIKAMFEGMASSITNDEERKAMEEQLNTMFAEGEFDLEELKVLMNKGGNWRSMWHTTIDRKRNFYDYAMDVESANAYLGIVDGNGSYDLGDVTIDQNTAAWQASMDEWYKSYTNASNDETKEAAKNKFLEIWNTNIKPNQDYYDYLKPKYKAKAEDMGISNFRLGTQWLASDGLFYGHAGERVLTKEQNKQYTESLQSSNGVLQAGFQDVVAAIQSQTAQIIDAIASMRFNRNTTSTLSMLPEMGNTRVVL